ncbi:MAG: anhydro-N-acetylmuramic acid kinase [Armatimonadetes bacterium]|nr:anhydro-N-acetylmuramic acid kinase [Armatimonadota bacterium]
MTTWPTTKSPLRVIGLISGTSVDGIDAAVVDVSRRSSGVDVRTVAALTREFSPDERARILDLCRPDAPLEAICAANFDLAEWFAAAALGALRQAGVSPADCDLIASHGQTIWHIPGHSTLQIGEAAVIAERTGFPVVSNFRPRDIAAGGQGAPLVSYLDYLVFRDAAKSRAAQNLGGIGNVTWIPASAPPEQIVSFDTGPGNMLIDGVTRLVAGQLQDEDGTLAGRGRVSDRLVSELLADPYYKQPPPKTTGREKFGEAYAKRVADRGRELRLGAEDLLATVTMLTARSIAEAYRRFLGQIDEAILSGGGVHNRTLVQMIAAEVSPASVRIVSEYGLDPDFKEAIAFAVFGALTAWGAPSNLPAATGARRQVILGDVTFA